MPNEANITNLKIGDKVVPKNESLKKVLQSKGIVYFIVKQFAKGSTSKRYVIYASTYTFKGKEKGLAAFYIDENQSELFFYEG